MPSFILNVLRVAHADLALIWRFRMMQLAEIGVALVPAVYALIYLSSVWDPNAKTSALPVGLVNLDIGVRYRNHETNVGQELVETLEREGVFGWRRMKDADAARREVSQGKLAFAVIIPEDFSVQAVPGAVAGAGKIRVILSEGNNYSSAGFARRFAVELGHQVNETLNEKRWALVLSSADGSEQSLARACRSGLRSCRRRISIPALAFVARISAARLFSACPVSPSSTPRRWDRPCCCRPWRRFSSALPSAALSSAQASHPAASPAVSPAAPAACRARQRSGFPSCRSPWLLCPRPAFPARRYLKCHMCPETSRFSTSRSEIAVSKCGSQFTSRLPR